MESDLFWLKYSIIIIRVATNDKNKITREKNCETKRAREKIAKNHKTREKCFAKNIKKY